MSTTTITTTTSTSSTTVLDAHEIAYISRSNIYNIIYLEFAAALLQSKHIENIVTFRKIYTK